jgi:hypothetical protein
MIIPATNLATSTRMVTVINPHRRIQANITIIKTTN